MNKSTCALMLVLAALTGCSGNLSRYHDQPLVAKVDTGMSKAQVLQIGGKPSAESDRTAVPGTCFDYMLTQPGQIGIGGGHQAAPLPHHPACGSAPGGSRGPGQMRRGSPIRSNHATVRTP